MTRLFSVILLLFCSCQKPDNSNTGWQKVFQNDENGETIFGDKSKLIDAVRLGYPIRIGWGSNRVEHVADADFLTIFEGEEVFAQIKTILGQAPRIDGDSLKIRFRTQNHWTSIAGTNGYTTSIMTNYMQDTLVGGDKDRYRSSTWYVLYPNHGLNIEAKPLWQKTSPNWEKWKKVNE
ncbi:hypothetical protein D1816_08410 [Aquimarina sp. AD10]|uniref:hypothetical protein n=1 Tax=Aquimarina sp. AD10 TaxID=1714849 RepID=UPI000E49DDD9|nr:hypothetical protein [Aquimarina sp. AD10]AXT60372.1 hypothetical protein D1816_08410 [Aquimarina sp. AD10]RKN01194.1 hypothetical protein D7033_05070 [Aquimarina sp. AD10]